MSPRPYQLGRRQAASEQTRISIIAAARQLLLAEDDATNFSVDAIARQAGVARMTVYYQFGSKTGLLEALFDDLALRGQMEQLASAFRQPKAFAALAAFIAAFYHFWASDRLIIRRLRSFAALDSELEQALQARDERRREGLQVIIRRLAGEQGRPTPDHFEETVDLLHMLISFESFDNLSGSTRSHEEAASLVYQFVVAALGLSGEAQEGHQG